VRILLLRSAGAEAPSPPLGPDVDVLVTHQVVPAQIGIAEALAVPARGTWVVASSATTVAVLWRADTATPSFFARPFAGRVAAGEETAAAMRHVGASLVTVPSLPGAAGILEALPHGPARILWPRGSDAAGEPLAELRARGASVTSPVVYEKRPIAALDPGALTRFAQGGYAAVAVSSLAALEVLLDGLKRAKMAVPGGVRWGVIGPESARAFERYSLPRPIVPQRARLADLIDALRKANA
jgi:uroporphyrinogen-III synthase